MTETGRQMLQRQRPRLNREQAALGEKLVNEARHATSMTKSLAAANDPVHNAVSRGIVRRVAGVLASEKVTPAIQVQPVDSARGEVMQAYTDFTSIHVAYTPHSDKRLLAATLRGLMYHEGGHIRWTTPYQTLVQQMVDTFLGGSIYTSAWRAHVERLPVGMERPGGSAHGDGSRQRQPAQGCLLHADDHDRTGRVAQQGGGELPAAVWRRYLPKHIRRGARKGFVAWHGPTATTARR